MQPLLVDHYNNIIYTRPFRISYNAHGDFARVLSPIRIE